MLAVVRVAVAQMSCSLGDIAENLRRIAGFSERAKADGAGMIVFPEMVDTGYSMAIIRKHATSWAEGAVPKLCQFARKLSLQIVCGVSERSDLEIHNSQVVIDRDGKILAKYRKTHLFVAPPIAEHLCFTPGDRLADFQIPPFRFGLSICYDLRFPELYRKLVTMNNVNAFIISSAWPFPRIEHFRALAIARAIENQSYVLAANRVGTDDGVTFCGSSAIIDPSGVVLASASTDQDELLQADISQEMLDAVRSRMQVFADRRSDLYG
jgi:predicted amidohydrolase